VVLIAAMVAGAAALYSSFDALVKLAEWAGWSKDAAPGLPLTVDVIALAAGVRYVRLHPDAEGRALAFKGVTWSAVASVVGNAIVHAGLTPDWSWQHRAIAVLVSAVPALGIAYVVHLVAAPIVRQLGDDDEHQDVPAEEEPAPDPEPEEEPEEETAEEEPEPVSDISDARKRRHAKPREGSIKARGLLLMREAQEKELDPPTTNDLVTALGCTPRHAQNIVNAWNAS
jgi:hypothetical protein